MGDPIAAVTARATGRGEAVAIAAIVAGAAGVAALVGVRGDFPLSDDWSYAWSARALCEEGALRFMPWTGTSLVLQTWYGAALCHAFGFSFEVLRASTLALATLGAIGFWSLLGWAGVRGTPRALAAALFALDPLYVNLAFTFMTDVPFTVAAVWAGYCYVRGFATRRRAWLVAGSCAAAAALLIRQHGIFVAAAASLSALVEPDRPWRARVADACAAGAIALAASLGFHVWLFAIHGAPLAVSTKLGEASRMHPAGVVNAAFRGLETLALLAAPLALALRRDLAARHRRLVIAATSLLAILAVLLFLRTGAAMFYLTNVMYDLGLGASSLRDTQFLALRHPVELGPALGVALTLVATLAAGILTVGWADGVRRRREPAAFFLAAASALLFLGSLLHARYYFDRYLLAVLPFALAALAVAGRAELGKAGLALAALLAWYAIAGTHDYLAWNRARWAGLAELAAAGVAPTEIDGGMEFNGWTLAATLDRWPTDAEARRGQPPTRKSWWWVVDDRFVVSFRPLPGYVVRQSRPYTRWLPPGTGRVVVLERAAS
ncbi:MAG: glycosyltransferase family 39 protein [Deltaproteobacteria bacterium]|nr:glycosyltransferase family 39 protein [Deltaproteobacteria bacterium]